MANEDYKRNKYFLWIVLLVALGLRLYLAGTTTYLWDEERDWILLADSISFTPGNLNLPVRGDFHGALSAYFIKFSSVLFGTSHVGYRLIGLISGLLTIVVLFRLTLELAGIVAAKWMAVLLAFNEYHIQHSVLAITNFYHLFFAACGSYAFCRFLRTQKAKNLYLAAVAMGAAFLTYEISLLLIPAFLLAVILSGNSFWLKRKEPYLASLLFLLIISPDLYWNFASQAKSQVNYSDHLGRVGGLGLSEQPLYFYMHPVLNVGYKLVGAKLKDAASEFVGMNPLFGIILLGSALWLALRSKGESAIVKCLLVCFWLVFIFFSLIRAGSAGRAKLDTDLWIWVDVTLIPAVVLAGYCLSRLQGWLKGVAVVMICIASLYAVYRTVIPRLTMPNLAVNFDPEVFGSMDGRMVPVEAHFDHCDFCDSNPKLELLSIRIVEKRETGAQIRLVDLETTDVEGAQLGTDDRAFALRATGADQDRRYEITWRLTDKSGKSRELTAPIWMKVASEKRWRQPFWVRNELAQTGK